MGLRNIGTGADTTEMFLFLLTVYVGGGVVMPKSDKHGNFLCTGRTLHIYPGVYSFYLYLL